MIHDVKPHAGKSLSGVCALALSADSLFAEKQRASDLDALWKKIRGKTPGVCSNALPELQTAYEAFSYSGVNPAARPF